MSYMLHRQQPPDPATLPSEDDPWPGLMVRPDADAERRRKANRARVLAHRDVIVYAGIGPDASLTTRPTRLRIR